MREKLLAKIWVDLKKKSIPQLALEIGIEYRTLYNFIKNARQGSIVQWEKIERYYKERGKHNAR